MKRIIEKTNFDGSKKERFASIKVFTKYYPEYDEKKIIYKIRYALKNSKSKSFDTDTFKLERFNVQS